MGAYGVGGGDIGGAVADQIGRADLRAGWQEIARPLEGEFGYLVAVGMFMAKSSQQEWVIYAGGGQLDAGATFYVAGDQTCDAVGIMRQLVEKGRNAWQGVNFVRQDSLLQLDGKLIKESEGIVFRQLAFVSLEYLAQHIQIGCPAEMDIVDIVGPVENRMERANKRRPSSSTALHKSSVYIEKHNFMHDCSNLIALLRQAGISLSPGNRQVWR